MAEKAGEIYYDIEANVSGLIQAQQQVNKRLDQMDAKFEQSSRSAGRFEGALNKVGVAIAAAFTIDAAKKLIAIGDEMVTLQARIARLSPSIDVAKETLSSLSAIASQTGNSLSETERLAGISSPPIQNSTPPSGVSKQPNQMATTPRH